MSWLGGWEGGEIMTTRLLSLPTCTTRSDEHKKEAEHVGRRAQEAGPRPEPQVQVRARAVQPAGRPHLALGGGASGVQECKRWVRRQVADGRRRGGRDVGLAVQTRPRYHHGEPSTPPRASRPPAHTAHRRFCAVFCGRNSSRRPGSSSRSTRWRFSLPTTSR